MWTKRILISILLTVINLIVGTSFVVASTLTDETANSQKERHEEFVNSRDNTQAVLSNTQERIRLCCQRTQRLSPSSLNSFRHGSTTTHRFLFHYQKVAYRHYRCSSGIATRAIIDEPQCDYYILTLRHLIC